MYRKFINPLPESGSFFIRYRYCNSYSNFTGAPGAVATYYNIVMAIAMLQDPANKFSIWNG
jgi:hypothetical protein